MLDQMVDGATIIDVLTRASNATLFIDLVLARSPRPKANEPYELWKGMDRRGDEYKRLKEERAKALWQASRAFRGVNAC